MSDLSELDSARRRHPSGLADVFLFPIVGRAEVDLRTCSGWRTLGYCLRRTRPWQLRALGRLVRMAWRDTRGRA